MFGKTKTNDAGITLVANNCELTGDIRFSDQLVVNGIIKGNVYAAEGSKAIVTVSETGLVEGDIRAPKVVVNGKVTGDIHSDKHVELAAKAEIRGNVYYNLIEMVMGSRVEGNLVHVADGKEKAQVASAAGVASGQDDAADEEPDAMMAEAPPAKAPPAKAPPAKAPPAKAPPLNSRY